MRITRTVRRGGRSRLFRDIIHYWWLSSILICSGFTSRVAVARDTKGMSSRILPLNGTMSSDVVQTIAATYNTCLIAHPLMTKSITAFSLCSTGDLIAQKRARKGVDIDWGRVCRFALKGVGSSMIWNCWYESADDVALDVLRPFHGAGEVSAPIRIGVAMLIDQFIWAPLAFGSYDIPVATLLNGASIRRVPSEVRSKLGGMLVSNALVWTPANLFIYTVPPIYRVGTSNLVDILWQSLMADVAADCGAVEDAEVKSKARGVSIDANPQPVRQ